MERILARVLYTVGTNMYALNAGTGATDPGFGKEGVVDVEITWGGAPYVFKNLIIMGNNNGERTEWPPATPRFTTPGRAGNCGASKRWFNPAIRTSRERG